MTLVRKVYVGLGVRDDAVSCVGVCAGALLWSSVIACSQASALEDSVTKLLASVPMRHTRLAPRARVTAALGPARAQVRRLTRLPQVRRARDLPLLVRENLRRFFVQRSTPTVFLGAQTVEPGVAWAAVTDDECLSSLRRGCERAGCRLDGVVPTVVALERAYTSAPVDWHDGGRSWRIRYSSGGLSELTADDTPLAPGAARDSESNTLTAALRVLGDDGWRYADAYGAALMPTSHALRLTLRWTADSNTARRSHIDAWRASTAAGAASLSMIAAVTAPGFTARAERVAANRQLVDVETSRREAESATHYEQALSESLEAVDSMRSARGRAMRLLGDVASLMPPDGALESIRVDGTTVEVVAVAPRGGEIVARLARSAFAAEVENVGAITHDAVGGESLERVRVRFRFTPTLESERAR